MDEKDITAMATAYAELQRGFPLPQMTIICNPEGTWLLQTDKEPKLLGEEKDFERIFKEFFGMRR